MKNIEGDFRWCDIVYFRPVCFGNGLRKSLLISHTVNALHKIYFGFIIIRNPMNAKNWVMISHVCNKYAFIRVVLFPALLVKYCQPNWQLWQLLWWVWWLMKRINGKTAYQSMHQCPINYHYSKVLYHYLLINSIIHSSLWFSRELCTVCHWKI